MKILVILFFKKFCSFRFVKLASHFVEPEEDYETMKEHLRELFVFYDREQRGYIPAADFKAILKELEPDLPDEEIAEMVKELGKI